MLRETLTPWHEHGSALNGEPITARTPCTDAQRHAVAWTRPYKLDIYGETATTIEGSKAAPTPDRSSMARVSYRAVLPAGMRKPCREGARQ